MPMIFEKAALILLTAALSAAGAPGDGAPRGGIGVIITRGCPRGDIAYESPVRDPVCISSVLDGFPAAKAGLTTNDDILAVDGVSVHSLTVEQVEKRLRGRPGTKIRVTIGNALRRPSIKEFVLVRKRFDRKAK